ncbi:GNAT family N-acetyltransferase [Opitutaceae bacterium EW11]|nr:GNAT family N-acetyltransferase [Opitutaceae bacterium EW11]
MNTGIEIRDETPDDFDAITAVTVAAFRTLEISSHTEQFIVLALRRARALSVSLVAEANGQVVGHIALSPVTVSDSARGWYGLGPISVLPIWQRRGVGKALMDAGLSRLKTMGARGCCLVGHPEYYPKFGFRNPAHLVVDGVPSEAFFVLSFDGNVPTGRVAFHDAFNATG